MTTSTRPSVAAGATTAAADPSNPSYDRRTIALHWLTAALVFGMWGVGQTIDFFPRGMARDTVRSLHMTVGVVLAIVLVVRLSWRHRGGAELPLSSPGLDGRLAVVGHQLLYALLAAALVAGMAYAWARGATLFGLFTVPSFAPGDRELTRRIGEVHAFLTNGLLIVALGHASIALWHHHVMKDGVLRRMWPGLRRPDVD